jgi:hypothetical protein
MRNTRYQTVVLLFVACFVAGCSGESQEQARSDAESATEVVSLKGPQIVQDMIAAHGGMEAWADAPTMSFTDQWGDDGTPSTYVIEQGRRRAYMDMATGPQLAWDGEKAWSVDWERGTPVRFLALLNYYFINLPWLTQDPGVVLAEPGTGTLPDDPTEYVTVMMTFEPNVGDTPDDYYQLYIHPDTHLLRACDYIVTYQALMGPGETSTPEHCLVYDEMTTAGGLTVPSHFTIYEGDAVYATCTVTDISFQRPFDTARMTMPEGAVVDTSTP